MAVPKQRVGGVPIGAKGRKEKCLSILLTRPGGDAFQFVNKFDVCAVSSRCHFSGPSSVPSIHDASITLVQTRETELGAAVIQFYATADDEYRCRKAALRKDIVTV